MDIDLDDELLARLVQEAALEYYTPEQIAEQVHLPKEKVARILALPGVKARIAAVRRSLIEDGSRFSTLARRLADETIPQVAMIMNDPGASAADKLKAFDLLVRFSGLAPKESATPSVVINLNAALEQADRRASSYITVGTSAPTPLLEN